MAAGGPALLAAHAIRYPVFRPIVVEKICDHRFGAMFVGDEDRAVGVMKNPQPVICLADAQPFLVRCDDGAGQEFRPPPSRIGANIGV